MGLEPIPPFGKSNILSHKRRAHDAGYTSLTNKSLKLSKNKKYKWPRLAGPFIRQTEIFRSAVAGRLLSLKVYPAKTECQIRFNEFLIKDLAGVSGDKISSNTLRRMKPRSA